MFFLTAGLECIVNACLFFNALIIASRSLLLQVYYININRIVQCHDFSFCIDIFFYFFNLPLFVSIFLPGVISSSILDMHSLSWHTINYSSLITHIGE